MCAFVPVCVCAFVPVCMRAGMPVCVYACAYPPADVRFPVRACVRACDSARAFALRLTLCVLYEAGGQGGRVTDWLSDGQVVSAPAVLRPSCC